ncbi:uncharacterized protein LOC124933495 [Impatiens glandulifera]|uniref:uncharacterized protein LOC124933495 n=1 Tax=Impatiens glandulifera TaxID=253017 RepID=UPI001FB14A29|nr:uncharacterized protein LOC124933495 [Impatiens glandulifera]XP_047329860.1 uncharacterized protein LOC124933495 [Impatiens glandulifera]XP_047329861.1 uncharacterized protein LOC124933495 [Impatiens glandulifera]XP_047329862.1 uncharacterized protein LOC124933495 [Impatiens glandulifera]
MDVNMEKTFDWGDGQSNVAALSLDYHPGLSNGIVSNRKRNPLSISPLALSLGFSSSSCTSLGSRKENEEESSYKTQLNCVSSIVMFEGVELQKPKLDLELSLSTGFKDSDVTTLTQAFKPPPDIPGTEGSVSSRWKCGSVISSFLASQTMHINPTDEIPNQRRRITNVKLCQFQGCGKGARGATKFCISHGGGKRCKREGCPNGAEGKTVFCKAHGGGNRCIHLGCTKSAEGRTDLCIRHGGGRRCIHEGCSQAARGKQTSLCIKHGGGKRCKIENCDKSAEGMLGLCISHGGGRRCERPECTKSAQGGTKLCKAHGGGKRCQFVGCSKGAEGSTMYCKGHGGGKRCSYLEGCPKSVHGGTMFCVRHGGGKRCLFPECSKSARGRTNFCVRHGGGKRCSFVGGCGKSAQGRSDFCKGHGGGKRCSWGGQPSCDKFVRGKSSLCAAHNTTATINNDMEWTSCSPFFINQTQAMDSSSAKEDPTTTLPLQFSLPEGRVHGGSLMAMLEGSRNLGGN